MKVKHILGVHNKLPEYPTKKDLLFDLEVEENEQSKALDENTLVTKSRLKKMYSDEAHYEKALTNLDALTQKGNFRLENNTWIYQPVDETDNAND